MNIGIIGAGPMGQVLARKLVQLGNRVRLANSRGPTSLADLAMETGATPVALAEAARATNIVFLAIPTKAVAALPKDLFADAPGVVIDIGNYHPELRDGRIAAIDGGMLESEWVAREIGRPVIKAFNSILAESLSANGAPKGSRGRIALPVSGDDPENRALVLALVDLLGFDPVDAGDLGNSWRQQPGTPAYCHDLDAASLTRALVEADRSRIADYRAAREAEIKRMMAGQS